MARTARSVEDIEAGFWVVLAAARGLIGEGGAPADPADPAVGAVVERGRAAGGSISMGAYEKARKATFAGTTQGAQTWPAGAQTVSKVLGGGSWSGAMEALGLSTSSRGRAAGSGRFAEGDFVEAVRAYVAAADAPSYKDYGRWVLRERGAGRQWPTGPTMRQHFGSWGAAMASAAADGGKA